MIIFFIICARVEKYLRDLTKNDLPVPSFIDNSSFAQEVFINIGTVMPMTFTFRENFENFEDVDAGSFRRLADGEKMQILTEKLNVPHINGHLHRARLDRLLKRSLDQVGAVLITGRAGTGKTSIAANFARQYERKVWYGVEAADADWNIFSHYLSKGIWGNSLADDSPDIREMVDKLMAEPPVSDTPRLIVLDDIHHVFDAKWFNDFFGAILQTASPATHLLFLSRSKPAFPLWRLRSKQALTVIDEKIIAFDQAETSAFCEKAGVLPGDFTKFYAESFGRIGKLKALVQTG
jgi:ATP/maltotriose-dependent transcriptional regulator MalT